MEVSQIESQNASDRYSLVQAEGNLATAVTALKNVLALGLDYDLNIADITLDGKDVNLPLPSKKEISGMLSRGSPESKATISAKRSMIMI